MMSEENYEYEKEKYLSARKLIKFRKGLFLPSSKQIIYVENENNVFLNKFFNDNYEQVNQLFNQRGYQFVFIPKLLSEVKEVDATKILQYIFPHINELSVKQREAQNIYDLLFSLICNDEEKNLYPGLIRLKGTQSDCYFFSYLQITFFEEKELWQQLNLYIQHVGDKRLTNGITEFHKCNFLKRQSNVFMGITNPDVKEYAAENFEKEVLKIAEEIRVKIEKLKQLGVNELVIKSLFSLENAQPKLSHLLITNEYKIILPDYNNLEIKMHPLPKAVFFLFLKHPKGILFKYLSDYRKELLEIYKKVATRGTIDDYRKSIEDVTDPTKNSINEKCARIREAFIRELDENLAKNYFITGERFSVKKIQLDRSLIINESDI
ncbi:hypothetical protein M2138_001392 [Dysgonomonadaceae bacterium PH5-43]|nr:hypothetical protein [Dysgonomonadaceae bacterium PH5-43]